jgi:uncharacterized membrane protein
MKNVAPLSGSLMMVSILGFLVSIMWLWKLSMNWAFSIGFLSIIIFIATMISVTNAPVEEELSLDEQPKKIVRKTTKKKK